MKPYGHLLFSLLLLLPVACTQVTPETTVNPETTEQPQPRRRGMAGLAATTGLKLDQETPAPKEEAKTPETPAEPAAEQPEAPAEEEAEKDKTPGFFARLFGWTDEEKEPETATPVTKGDAVVPTPAQQAAARRLLETDNIPTPAPLQNVTPTDEDFTQPTRNGLRLGRFAPPEEASASAESPGADRPNSVELRGLRSPSLPAGRLPMDINGKLTTDKRN